MNPFSPLVIKGLGIALGVSLLANAGMGLYVRAIRAETANAIQSLDSAVEASKSNITAMQALQKALGECVGKKEELQRLSDAAQAERDKAAATAASRAQQIRDLKAKALESASCRANAETPVCPGLVLQ